MNFMANCYDFMKFLNRYDSQMKSRLKFLFVPDRNYSVGLFC